MDEEPLTGEQPGSILGKYRLLAELGSGGMSTVYLAVVRGPGGFHKLVVLKVLRQHLARDPEILSMFLDEARLAARLHHPNVVQTNEVGTEAGRHLIVMEYLDGQALNQIVERGRRHDKPLPLGLHLRIIHDALHGLHHAHELTDFDGTPLQLVHRDMSPHNVFVTFDGHVKVLDFGIAKAASSSNETKTGVIKGKIRYMAPEQFSGERVDRRADIFSVGTMLWEVATGEKLWKGRSDVEIMNRVVNGTIPAPREINPMADERLDRICRKALAKDRDHRYPTCIELQADIERLVEEMGVKTGSREIGRFTAELFADVRAERKRVIEQQLSKADALGTHELRALPVSDMPSASVPNLATAGGSFPPPEGTPSTGQGLMPMASSLPSPRRGGLGVLLVAALAGAGLLAAALVFFLRRADDAPRGHVSPTPPTSVTATPTASGTAASTVAAPEPVREVTLTVRAEPADAKVFLDGQPMSEGTKKLARDGAAHQVRAEARGYQTKTVSALLDQDRDITVVLEKERPGLHAWTPRPAHPSQPTTTPAPVATAVPTPTATDVPRPNATGTGRKPSRPLDPNNPWE